MQTANTGECYHGRHTAGANVRREEGEQPRPPAEVPKVMVKWETMWEGPDSQDVGLEAAII